MCVKTNVTVSTGRKSWALVTSSFVRLAETAARPITFDSFQQQPNVRRRTPQECQSEPTQQQQHICISYIKHALHPHHLCAIQITDNITSLVDDMTTVNMIDYLNLIFLLRGTFFLKVENHYFNGVDTKLKILYCITCILLSIISSVFVTKHLTIFGFFSLTIYITTFQIRRRHVSPLFYCTAVPFENLN